MFQIGTSLARQKVLETAPCRTNGRMHARLESRWRIDRHLMRDAIMATSAT